MEKINGKTLLHWRKKREISQGKLANAVGCSRQNISKIENGKVDRVHKKLLDELAKYLKIERGELQNDNWAEEELKNEQTALIRLIDRFRNDDLRESDKGLLRELAKIFELNEAQIDDFLGKQQFDGKIVLARPIIRGSRRGRIQAKINYFSEDRLPIVDEILEYLKESTVNEIKQIREICKVLSFRKFKISVDNKPMNQFIYDHIMEREIQTFGDQVFKALSNYELNLDEKKEKKQMRSKIKTDLTKLRRDTLKNMEVLLKNWKMYLNTID